MTEFPAAMPHGPAGWITHAGPWGLCGKLGRENILCEGWLMPKPAAKQGDKVVGTDTHIVMIPSPGGPVPTPMPLPFSGTVSGKLSPDVLIEKKPAAVAGSTADNLPPHVPPGGPFQKSPSNKGTIKQGSKKVLINNKEAARAGDVAETCNDPSDAPTGTVVATGTVLIGD